MDTDFLTYAIIGVAFLINLIITFAFRIADKKDRTLKNINNQIKNFRTEVNSTVARVNTTAKDCEINIQSRVEQADAANSKLAESLDMLMVHQKELSDLEYICKSYKIALEKLKGQTEQAEARILAVQSEVRKAESINAFTLSFQADAERLTNQMQDLKTEYVRLIASTEQGLKNAAQNQQEENSRALMAFSDAIERARGELVEFSNNEKIGIQELFNHQEAATEEALNRLDQHSKLINDSIEDATDSLDRYKRDLEESLKALDAKRLDIDSAVSDVFSKFKLDMENTGEAVANTLESKISDKEDELNASFDLYCEKLSDRESQSDKILEEIDTRKALALSSLDLAIDSKKKDIEGAITKLENEKDLYVSRSQEALDKVFKESLAKTQDYIASIRSSSDDLVQHLSDRIGESREAYAIVSSGAEDKLAKVVETLSDLEGKIKSSQSSFNALSEAITTKKQELYDINKSEQDAKDKLDKIYVDMQKAKDAAQQAKEARINEEARVVRLKFQQSTIKKQEDDKEKDNSDESQSKKKPEEMIEEFPDDIEYVDLSDDDEKE